MASGMALTRFERHGYYGGDGDGFFDMMMMKGQLRGPQNHFNPKSNNNTKEQPKRNWTWDGWKTTGHGLFYSTTTTSTGATGFLYQFPLYSFSFYIQVSGSGS